MVNWHAASELLPLCYRMMAKMEAGATKAIALSGGEVPSYWIFHVDSYEVRHP